MTIQAYIKNLRAKPEGVRKQIAFWSSLAITVLIGLFWIASMSGATSYVADSASGAMAAAVGKVGTPAQTLLSSIGSGVSSLFGDVKDLILTPKKITYSSVEVTSGR